MVSRLTPFEEGAVGWVFLVVVVVVVVVVVERKVAQWQRVTSARWGGGA